MSTTLPSVRPHVLAVSVIERSPTNPREHFDPEKEKQLAETLRPAPQGVGFLQPLLVRPWPGRAGLFELVDGERRWRAAKSIGITEVPVTVRDLTAAEVIAIQLVAGDTGEPLSPLEEAKGFKTALELKGPEGQSLYTMRSLAEKLGCGKTHIEQRIDLLRLPSNVREWVSSGSLAPRTANLLARIPDAEARERAIQDIVFPKHREDPLPFKEAEAVIHERYMVSLRAAPFDVNDATFDGPMVDDKTKKPLPLACAGCPLKTGNNPEKFGDVKDKNTCTNPGCYRAKCNAGWDRAAAKAKAAGQRVLTEEETADVFEKNSPVVQIAFSSPYVDVNAKPNYRHVANEVEDKNLPTWRDLLQTAEEKKKIKVPIVLARDRTGKQWELVQMQLAIEAARAIGEDMFKKVPAAESMSSKDRFDRDTVRTTVRQTDDFAAKKKAEADATKKRTVESCLAMVKLHDALSLKILGYEPITDALLHPALHHAGNDGQALFVKAFGLETGGGDFETSDAIEAWFKKRSKSDKHAAIAVLIVAQSMRWNGLKCEGFTALAESVKFDVAAIEKEAAKQLAAKPAKGGKPAAASAPASGPAARPKGRELTKGETAELTTMITVGKKPADIAFRFGISAALTKWYIGQLAPAAAVVTTDKKTLGEWLKARASGMTDEAIAKSYKVPLADVQGALGSSQPAAADNLATTNFGLSEGKYVAVKTLLKAGKAHTKIAAQLGITVGQVDGVSAEVFPKKPATSGKKGGAKK